MEEWETDDEQEAIRDALVSSICFATLAEESCTSVIEVSSARWTHKATCPFHKGGRERTPSLNLSDETKKFYCYGCSAHGDIFDFIGLLRGSPGSAVFAQHRAKVGSTLPADFKIQPKSKVDVNELHIRLSTTIREMTTTEDDIRWADELYFRMDERFQSCSNPTDMLSFYMQVQMEIDRRLNECKDSNTG